MKRLIASAVLLSLLCCSTAFAQQSRHSIVWKDTSAVRYNPLGLVTAGELEYRLRMYNSGATIFKNYISLAATPILSPAYTRLGAKLEIVPIALLSLAVKYEFIQYFGGFDFFQSFPDQTANMSDDALAANGDAGENYSTSGTQLSLIGLLQMKVGPIAVRNRVTVFQNHYELNAGDTVMYDPFLDIVLPGDGWAMTNELDVLYIKRALIAGVRHTFVRSFIDEVPDDPNASVHRLGPLVLYEVFHRPAGHPLSSIKLLGLFQWYLQHRYRAGQESSAALPYMGVGAILEGTIL